ncbi:ribosome biogenesis protein BOP1, putative [Plasmodium chabaudi chabaudi]|uniref:Ribosome biogenesis protein BOP1 homolog n=1 Tax=Plasmodium chabaudi chabaudi TaxID=31271 RepID=A0A4V0K3S5_PLACU|nr:ribosome biogenesis protein BOP1, putative [Plasmodium chabaudi chabaudi]VTZ66708.1 ribosome biogenesis protein BOP1, putative [Plasmodium chabaudi chabaudi]|eukprot:XP_016655666.1 BOP1-like protein, putative [Plasmodium chabaudi chabaudi]
MKNQNNDENTSENNYEDSKNVSGDNNGSGERDAKISSKETNKHTLLNRTKKNKNKMETKKQDEEGRIKVNGKDKKKKKKKKHNIYINEEIDDSDDEYNLNTIGNIDLKYYDDLDIIGYDIDGKKIKKTNENMIDDFIESKTDPDAWRKIKDKKNNRVVTLTDADLEIIRKIRENSVAKYLDESNYIYENDKEEYKLPVKFNVKKNNKVSKGEKMKVLKLMRYLIDKEKHPEKYPNNTDSNKEDMMLYDIWKNKIYDEYSNMNEISLPNILPGHKYSYNPPPELIYTESDERNILKNNKDAFIPKNCEKITNIEYYKKTYYDLYQRCLDIYLCSRSVKSVLDIKKEDLLPKLPTTQSLKPYPQYPFIKYDINDKIKNEDNGHNYICLNENDHIFYVIKNNKLYLFDILTSYNIDVIDLEYYFNSVLPTDRKVKTNLMIKINKTYSLLAISCDNFIILIQYESYVPPAKSSTQDIEKVYYNGKRQKSGNTYDTNKTDDHSESSKDADELESDEEDGSQIFENEWDDEDMSDDGSEKNDESGENDNNLKKNKYIDLSKNMIYCKTKELINSFNQNFKNSDEFISSSDLDIKWIKIAPNDKKLKYCVAIKHEGSIRHFSWNRNGNYLSVTCLRKLGQYHHCYLHHIKSMRTIKLINKYQQKRGDIIQSMFFPRNPYFVAAFENSIIIYNLKPSSKKEKIFKKLRGVKNATSIDIHTNESYILVSDERGNVFIYDLDLASSPYKMFHAQNCPLKKAEFHKEYNLFYSLGSNGVINLFYSKFFNDYITDPILVPIKEIKNEAKIVDLTWSDKKPWLFAHTESNFSVLYT